jgi:hypothetical protein
MTFQFKIQLKDINDPTVWRRVLVPADFTFMQFHTVIQVSFGWLDSHMFQFSPKGWGSSPQIQMPDDEDDSFSPFGKKVDSLDCEDVILSDIFTIEKQKYSYIYDFGDDWNHQIILEKILDEKVLHPICIKASGACPPEDCGGPWAYVNIKNALTDKKHPEHKDMKEWLGLSPRERFDAEEYDLEFINEELREIE